MTFRVSSGEIDAFHLGGTEGQKLKRFLAEYTWRILDRSFRENSPIPHDKVDLKLCDAKKETSTKALAGAQRHRLREYARASIIFPGRGVRTG